MSELSPSGGSEEYEACDDEGAAPCGRLRADEADSPYQGEMSSEARQKG